MRNRSAQIYRKACEVIPGGVNSPVRSFRHLRMDPLIVDSAAGDQLIDVDGNIYIDYCGSWGALIAGHAHPTVVKGTIEQLRKGSSYGASTEIEERIASHIVKAMPSIETIRFVNSGTEATMTAMRIARGYTERSKIVKFTGHYHGHSDPLLVQAGSGVAKLNPLATSKGVNLTTIADTICLPFNDFEALHLFFRTSPLAQEVAAVILEPVTGNMGVVPPKPQFLQTVREESQRVGALLIFDEVITGFRLGPQGAQGVYQIDPDLTCLGKVIGGGFPVAAVGGKRRIMEVLAPLGSVYQAGTLSGNPVALRAGWETLSLTREPLFYEELERKTNLIVKPVREALKNKKGTIQQAGSMFTLFFGPEQVSSKEDLKGLDEEMFIRCFHYLFERGIYLSPSSHEACFISSAHTDEHLIFTANTITQFISEFL